MRFLFISLFYLISIQFVDKPIVSIKVNPDTDKESKLYLSQLSSEVKYIKLQTSPECLIASIHKVLIDKDKVFISTYGNSPGQTNLFMFSDNGTFIRQFGKFGRGPGEYASITDFSLDKENDIIYLIDSMGKLLVFNYAGKCLEDKKVDFKPTGIVFHDNHLFMVQAWPTYFMNNGYALTIRDLSKMKPDLKLLNRSSVKFYKIIQNTLIYPNQFLSENNENQVTLIEAKFDTLYHVSSDGSLNAKYVIELDKKPPRDLFLSEEYQDSYKNYNGYSAIIETDNYICFQVWTFRSTAFLYLYNKSTGQLLKHNTDFDKQYIINDIDGGLPFKPMGAADNNVLYSYLNPLKLKSKLESTDQKNIKLKDPYAVEHLKSLTKNADLNDNPIIMLIKLSTFGYMEQVVIGKQYSNWSPEY